MSIDSDGTQFRIGDYQIDIIVHGFPGKSVCHGSLGFSTIALIRHGERVALVDVGSFGQRALLLDQLAQHGLKPADVTDVLLTHSHYDHAINWLMFPNANIVIGKTELDWSLQQPWGETVVPELYMRELQQWPNLQTVGDGDEVFPGITAHMTPGHTPGCLVFVLDCGGQDMVFTGDACKNRAELLSRTADMTYDGEVTRASIDAIWSFWSRNPGNILVPGHDLPMVQDNGTPRYLGKREAAIRAWYGEDLNKTTVISVLADSPAQVAVAAAVAVAAE
ncbi:MAG: MBL fold metallo-hydrolase [Alphaproteobacteria bacterium]|nr:MBL fold metallo-hydrolase [Alphaproteobacteria bacterium]